MTLIEMLVVVGIIGVMTSMVVPAFNSIGRTASLNSTGNQIADLMSMARQNSVSKNGMTAVVLVTDTTCGQQALAVMQLLPLENDQALTSSNWTQITGWFRLGAGVFADVNANDSSTCTTFQTAVNGAAQTSGPPLPVVTFGNKQPGSYKYVLFNSSGALFSGSNAMLFLSNGTIPAGSVSGAFNPPVAPGSSLPSRYYKLTAIAASGQVKIDLP
jgi:Tfp pilus assembly protein FimT